MASWRLFQVLYNGLGLVHLFWLLFGTVIIIPPAMLEGFYMRCRNKQQKCGRCVTMFGMESTFRGVLFKGLLYLDRFSQSKYGTLLS